MTIRKSENDLFKILADKPGLKYLGPDRSNKAAPDSTRSTFKSNVSTASPLAAVTQKTSKVTEEKINQGFFEAAQGQINFDQLDEVAKIWAQIDGEKA